MRGISSQDIIPVIKHFPGHGDTHIDSHIALPIINKKLEELMNFELIPFKDAIGKGVEAIMTAHILLPQIDKDYPASLSEIIISDILRESLQYEGVVITDDITMGAITQNYSVDEAGVKAVNAGNDIILVAHKYISANALINRLKAAVINEDIPEARIDESVYRILKIKHRYIIKKDNEILDRDNPNITDINNRINNIIDQVYN